MLKEKYFARLTEWAVCNTPLSKMSYPETEENLLRLKTSLINHYNSRTFNTCEHQSLQPMKLMVDPNAEPVAHHTPIPVPIHW